MDNTVKPDSKRFSVVTRESLDAAGQAVWDDRIKQVGNVPTGHFNVMMYAPELSNRVAKLESYFRFDATMSKKEREFVTLCVVREGEARFGWGRHEPRAKELGVAPEVIDLVRNKAPLEKFPDEYKLLVEFARELAGTRKPLPEELFNRAKAAWGERKTIEMIALIAHYTLVGVLINGYAVEARPGDGLTF
jgi:4-carboxymuconolactone decarboxylase